MVFGRLGNICSEGTGTRAKRSRSLGKPATGTLAGTLQLRHCYCAIKALNGPASKNISMLVILSSST